MKTRLYVAGVLGGVAAILMLAFVVLEFGISHPSPPSLSDHPHDEIPGSVLYFDNTGCVVNALASGRSATQVYCPTAQPGFADALTWVDERTFAYAVVAPGLAQPAWRWIRVDIATKRETDTTALTASPIQKTNPVSVRGESISFDPDGYLYLDNGRERVRAYKLPGGRNGGQYTFASWSPDGEWFILRYYPKNELWIIRRDGAVAGTLASNAMGAASWLIPGVGIQPTYEMTFQQD